MKRDGKRRCHPERSLEVDIYGDQTDFVKDLRSHCRTMTRDVTKILRRRGMTCMGLSRSAASSEWIRMKRYGEPLKGNEINSRRGGFQTRPGEDGVKKSGSGKLHQGRLHGKTRHNRAGRLHLVKPYSAQLILSRAAEYRIVPIACCFFACKNARPGNGPPPVGGDEKRRLMRRIARLYAKRNNRNLVFYRALPQLSPPGVYPALKRIRLNRFDFLYIIHIPGISKSFVPQTFAHS
jgi:hypothetical protein